MTDGPQDDTVLFKMGSSPHRLGNTEPFWNLEKQYDVCACAHACMCICIQIHTYTHIHTHIYFYNIFIKHFNQGLGYHSFSRGKYPYSNGR